MCLYLCLSLSLSISLSLCSMVGKTSLLTEILCEKEQFGTRIEQLVYIYTMEDSNIARLRKKYSKNGLFLREIPNNLPEILLPGGRACLVIDDKEDDIVGSKDKTRIVSDLVKIYKHHSKILMFLLLQSYDCFMKKNPLNPAVQNCEKLILFRSMSNFTSLKRWLNGYCIRLKGNQTLYEVYKEHILADRFAYLIIDCHTILNRLAYIHIYCTMINGL